MTTETTEMNLTTEQLDVMRRTLEYVVVHPNEWDQGVWGYRSDCGTAYCFAGHAAVTISRAAPVWRSTDLSTVVPREFPDGFEVEVEEYATTVLGLNWDQADALFAVDNSLRRLAELCYLYSNGAIDLLDRLPAPTDRDDESERLAAAATAYHWYTAYYQYTDATIDGRRNLVAALDASYPNHYRVGASA